MSTGARGEGYLKVDGQQVAVLFTNRALAEAERATGRTTLELADGAKRGSLGIGDTAVLLQVGLEHARREARAGGRSYTMSDAWRILDQVGFGGVAAVVLEAVAAVLAYSPPEEEGENPPE